MQLTLPQHLDFSLNASEHILRINKDVVIHFQKNRQDPPLSPEMGGQLFGIFNGNITTICCATGPREIDKRGRFFFHPARWLERHDIKKKFNQGLHYIGDWHTHPERCPTPSLKDIGSMEDCFHRSEHELNSFILVIVGYAEPPQCLWVSAHNSNSYQKYLFKDDSDEFLSRNGDKFI